MIISIASGKGGTGKTTVATNLARAMGDNVCLLDCDVEEPNAHLFLKPDITQARPFSVCIPEVDLHRCTLCGRCADICQFKAIAALPETVLIFPEMCHSCGGCFEVCPEDALLRGKRPIGTVAKGHTNGIAFAHGRLRIGEAMAPPLIRAVKSHAQTDRLTIIDAPPGTSCPFITAIRGTDFVVLVTEPTPFGLHDLKLAVEAVKMLGIPCGLIINRADLGTNATLYYAQQENIPILMQIPFERRMAEIYSGGQLIVDTFPEWRARFRNLPARIATVLADHETSPAVERN
jgi:MinD superfamily P-loop ATPase